MKFTIIKIIVLLSTLLIFPAHADSIRHIHLNGQHLSDAEILQLDEIAGSPVGDGDYWLNLQTGQWGFEGNPEVQGVLTSIANHSQQTIQANDYQQNNADSYNDWEGVSGTGTVTSGKLNGRDCTFISVGGTTIKSCD